MTSAKRQATIVEVARIANTSTATVSRVLSGADYPVSSALRDAVLKAAAELNYVPNAISQSLKIGKSCDIGVIIPSFSNPFYMQMISGVEMVCRQEGYNPIFCSSNNDENQEIANIELMRRKCVEGLILSSIHSDIQEACPALEMHEHVVLFDQATKHESCDRVLFDFEKGGYMAIRYLLQKGHRRIAFLSAPVENRHSRRALYRGCQKAVAEWGGGAECRLITADIQAEDQSAFEYETGRRLAREVLELEDRPTAVFVYNDIAAAGAMSQLTAKGLLVPRDISVVGFDDIILAAYTSPPLTTVRQPAFETGAAATRLIMDSIRNQNHTFYEVNLQPQLVERETVRDINERRTV